MTSKRIAFSVLIALQFTTAANAATLVYSNDVMGEIEPCGCRTNPQGGMLRKTNMMKALGPKDELLQLDAGDFFFSTDSIPELLAKQAEVQAAYLIKAHDMAGQDAIVPGEKDFALGVKTFRKLIKNSKTQFLAANLVTKAGKPLLKPYAIFSKRNGGKKLKIGVIGLVGKDLSWNKELKATDPVAAAKKLVPDLRKQVDVVIALTHQGYEADQILANAVPGIDIIIGGHSQTFIQKPVQTGSTWIFQTSFKNQYVGVVPLSRPMKMDDHRLVGLDAGFDDPEGKPGAMAKLVTEFKAAVADLNSKESEKDSGAVQLTREGGKTSKFQTFPRCAECHLKQFDFWRQTQHALALNSLVKAKQTQNKECLGCHTVGLGDKQGFSDVSRLAELRREGTELEPFALEDLAEYLKEIHDAKSLNTEVKLKRLDVAKPVKDTVSNINHSWTPVQCENCHQPGRDHPFSGKYSKNVEKALCLKCHTADRAPKWYTSSGQPDWETIAQKRVLITCPSGELTEE